MRSPTKYLIVTNNPLVRDILSPGYAVLFLEGSGYREVLVKVRDLVYAGHTLFTHPLSGSVKPNETPYKSVAVSKQPEGNPGAAEAGIIADAIAAFDRFTPRDRVLTDAILRDFRLIDYTLISGALDFDAEAGLNKIYTQNKQQ